MTRRISVTTFVGLLFIFAVCEAAAQKSQPTDPKIEAEINKVIRDYYDAWSRADEKAVVALNANDGFYYGVRSGYETSESTLKQFRSYFGTPEAGRTRFSYQIEDVKVIRPAADTAIANYKIITKTTSGDTSREVEERYTNVFVRREGTWKLIAEHSSDLPKPVAETVSGMPVDWIRTPAANAERYSMTVDTAVKHGGNASASIGFYCGDPSGFGSLAQAIAADDFIGKRVRLSGWLRSEKAEEAGLWMRLDGVNRTFGFDNMLTRPVKGTTDWRKYEVVLDVPPGTVMMVFGTLLVGTGRIWIDDLKLEAVTTDIPSTNQLSAEAMQVEYPNRLSKKAGSKQPVNLGFEDGIRP
jgi:uncharacterized protein (TIGR02246 family)